MRFLNLLAVFLLVETGGLAAQERVGSSLIDGKPVELYSDFTWRYKSSEPVCSSIVSGIDFCAAQVGWKKTARTSNEEAAAEFRYDDRHYGLLIVENLGENDGLSLELMKSVIIDNFAGVSGMAKEDVLVLGDEEGSVVGKSSSMVIYAGQIQGLSAVYANTIVMEPTRTSQIVSYSFGNDFSEKHRALHEDLVAALRFDH